jgi:hypothetical protein
MRYANFIDSKGTFDEIHETGFQINIIGNFKICFNG